MRKALVKSQGAIGRAIEEAIEKGNRKAIEREIKAH